ncbi:DUF952 domain-containing protein [Maritalea sp.]|jgi:uncharacterized protein (DUF952 family)|uniref:DUF952 domain-containing protein n=1 Tax=Maritalea sp. TaxID=2003361 RepID=UPI0039E5B1B0
MKIYKICSGEHWVNAQAAGVFTGVPIDITDGFIHFSTADQLAETLQKHFAGQSGLVMLTIDCDTLQTALKWEQSRGGALFPHLYADLALAAIVGEHELQIDDQGAFILPKEI